MKPDWHEVPTCAGWWWNKHGWHEFLGVNGADSICAKYGPWWGPWTPPPTPAEKVMPIERLAADQQTSPPEIGKLVSEHFSELAETDALIFEERADGCRDKSPQDYIKP